MQLDWAMHTLIKQQTFSYLLIKVCVICKFLVTQDYCSCVKLTVELVI